MASQLDFSERVQAVLLNSRKPSTRHSYKAKWEKYLAFLPTHLDFQSSLSAILDFLMDLRSTGLSYSSIRLKLFLHPLQSLLIILWLTIKLSSLILRQKGFCVACETFIQVYVHHHLHGTCLWFSVD